MYRDKAGKPMMADASRAVVAAVLIAHPLTYSGTYCECNPEHRVAVQGSVPVGGLTSTKGGGASAPTPPNYERRV